MKIMDRIVKRDRAMIGDGDLMLKERFTDGVGDTQLRREMRRYMFEHKDIAFTDFRHMVLRWTEDETTPSRSKGASVSEQEVNVKNEELKAKPVVKSESPALPTEITSLLQSQQEILVKQQQQLDVLTQMLQDKFEHKSFSRGTGRGRGRGSIKCYNCGGRGHISRECASEKKQQQQQQQTSDDGHECYKQDNKGKQDLNS